MPTSEIYANNQWNQLTDIEIHDGSSWRNVQEAFIYDGTAWLKVFPEPLPPTKITLTAEDTSLGPLESTSLVAQLKDVNNDPVGESRSITWSVSGGGTLSNQQTSTGGDGVATATFTSPNNNATSTITAASSGLTSGTVSITTTLPDLTAPDLTATQNIYGFDVTNNNYDSNNTYTLSFTGSGFGVSQWSGSVNSSFFGMYVPPRNDSAPVASSNGSQVSCTQGTWTVNPLVTITLTASRSGYNSASTQLTSTGTGSATTAYMWYYYEGTNRIQWGPQNPKNIGSLVSGKYVDCTVTRQRNGGAQTSVNSNKIGPL